MSCAKVNIFLCKKLWNRKKKCIQKSCYMDYLQKMVVLKNKCSDSFQILKENIHDSVL